MAEWVGEAASESAATETAAKRAHDPAEPVIGVFKGISGKRVARSRTAAPVQTTVRIRFGGCSGPSPVWLDMAGSGPGRRSADAEGDVSVTTRPDAGMAA